MSTRFYVSFLSDTGYTTDQSDLWRKRDKRCRGDLNNNLTSTHCVLHFDGSRGSCRTCSTSMCWERGYALVDCDWFQTFGRHASMGWSSCMCFGWWFGLWHLNLASKVAYHFLFLFGIQVTNDGLNYKGREVSHTCTTNMSWGFEHVI